jgi:hypothetical protein
MTGDGKPIGRFEYEATDELVTRGALALCQFNQLRVKKPKLRKGLFYLWLFLITGLSLLVLAVSYLIRGRGVPLQDWLFSSWEHFLGFAGIAFVLLLWLFLMITVNVLTILVRIIAPWSALRQVRKFAHRRIQYTLYEDRFESMSAARERSVPWRELREVHAVPDYWFLILRPRFTLYIPTPALSADLQSLIRRKVTEAGVKFEEWALPPLQAEHK